MRRRTGGRRADGGGGYRTKNKNPTRQCGEIHISTLRWVVQVDAYGRKTVRAFCFFFEYCSLSWGWGGVGGMLTFLVLRT